MLCISLTVNFMLFASISIIIAFLITMELCFPNYIALGITFLKFIVMQNYLILYLFLVCKIIHAFFS